MQLHIALGQMDVQLGQVQANLATVQRLTAVAADQGCDLLLLPELWSTGYDLENKSRYATPTDAGMFAELAQLAAQHQIAIVGSCLADLGHGRVGNTAVYFDKTGRSLGEYSKTHLFRLMAEEQHLVAGHGCTLIQTEWGLAGLAICYDLRFPELFRAYALAGANMILLPAEWPHPRLAHWRTLLQARAIENQLFVVACNRVGESKNSRFFGHSCIIDPWGEMVVEGDEEAGLLTAVVDLDRVADIRAKIPVFADRRPDIYF